VKEKQRTRLGKETIDLQVLTRGLSCDNLLTINDIIREAITSAYEKTGELPVLVERRSLDDFQKQMDLYVNSYARQVVKRL
jgi:hypothetical protein